MPSTRSAIFVSLLIVTLSQWARAQAVLQGKVRFVSADSAEWRSNPDGAVLGKLTQQAQLYVDEEPVTAGELVRTTTADGTVRWVEARHIALDLSATEYGAELLQARVTARAEPPLAAIDTVLVSAPGGKAMHRTLRFVYVVTTQPLARLGPSCPPSIPSMKNFRDGRNWMLMTPMDCQFGRGVSVSVPKGFVTDFASIPFYLRWLVGPTGPYGMAAVVHDFLYWDQRCGKTAADHAFRRAMEEAKVSAPLRTGLYTAVALFGGAAYVGNAAEKRVGYVRAVAAPDDDVPAGVEWVDYRESLRKAKKKEATYQAPSQAVCRL